MAHTWPHPLTFRELKLFVLDQNCWDCGGPTTIRDYRRRPVYTLEGPTRVARQLRQCLDERCLGHEKLMTAEEDILIAPPLWILAWDAFAHLGQARFARHMSVPEIREELADHYDIHLSEDCIEDYVGRYQAMLAARQRDPELLREHYRSVDDLILTIDGLQPEKGHETLYTVRELNGQRVWFASTLLSSSHDEVEKLIVRAKQMAEQLGKPIRAWMSDKQDAFVKGIAKVCPGVPHRYCQNHFLRDVAAPVLEADSHAKVQMRKKVRGLRTIEKEVLQRKDRLDKKGKDSDGDQVVLDYCATVRGILNKNQGGPLDPPGLRMAEGLKEVRESLQANLDEQVGGLVERDLKRLSACIDRGLDVVQPELTKIPEYVKDLRAIHDTLDPKKGKPAKRQAKFTALCQTLQADSDPVRQSIATVMSSFEPGLFAGGQALDALQDNLDLERWFRLPKSHERKIHGRQHAGVRLVHEGPGLALALDAHHSHRRPFTEKELGPYLGAMPTDEELQAVERRKIMRRATSREARPNLLASLETRYRSAHRKIRARQSRD